MYLFFNGKLSSLNTLLSFIPLKSIDLLCVVCFSDRSSKKRHTFASSKETFWNYEIHGCILEAERTVGHSELENRFSSFLLICKIKNKILEFNYFYTNNTLFFWILDLCFYWEHWLKYLFEICGPPWIEKVNVDTRLNFRKAQAIFEKEWHLCRHSLTHVNVFACAISRAIRLIITIRIICFELTALAVFSLAFAFRNILNIEQPRWTSLVSVQSKLYKK